MTTTRVMVERTDDRCPVCKYLFKDLAGLHGYNSQGLLEMACPACQTPLRIWEYEYITHWIVAWVEETELPNSQV